MLEFHLSYNNGEERLRLPVNPPSITVESSFGYSDVNVAQLGEFTVFGDETLRGFSLESFFPARYNEAYCEYVDIPEPWDAVEKLERWKSTRRPIRLTITGTGKNPINYPVTIRTFTYREQAGAPGDVYYTLELREYRFIEVRKMVEPQVLGISSDRPSDYVAPGTYVVKKGDSLWKIAANVYKRGDDWRKIYEANKTVIGANPSLIYPGQTLVIPGNGGGGA